MRHTYMRTARYAANLFETCVPARSLASPWCYNNPSRTLLGRDISNPVAALAIGGAPKLRCHSTRRRAPLLSDTVLVIGERTGIGI